MDWIQGDKFIGLADFTFASPKRRNDDYDNLPNTFSLAKCRSKMPCIVYTHTMYVNQLFDMIEGFDHKFIVITHNSDANVNFAPPGNVMKWYSQNVNIMHERVKSIPIGLENNRWFGDIRKKEKMLAKLQQPRNHRNLVYMNFNISTNPAKREKPYRILKNKPWVTTRMGSNGREFDDYLDNIYSHKFVVCPEGNGIDTHRIWECLYMGTIPIVENNINNSFYYKLPMLTVNRLEDMTEDYLLYEYAEIKARNQHSEMLNFEYWKNKITKP